MPNFRKSKASVSNRSVVLTSEVPDAFLPETMSLIDFIKHNTFRSYECVVAKSFFEALAREPNLTVKEWEQRVRVKGYLSFAQNCTLDGARGERLGNGPERS